MKILLCNVSWMNRYAGVTPDDTPRHGGDYVREHGFGHEAINFAPLGDTSYGFVQLRTGTINISRLDAGAGSEIDDVLVIWRARSNQGSVIIGWYKHATVYRKLQEPMPGHSFTYKGETITPQWIVKAKKADTFLVPPHQRVFKVPVSHKGFGSQTFVSFLDSETKEVTVFRDQVTDYISKAEKGLFTPPTKGKKGPIDQVRKLRIEKAAIDAVADFYTDRGYDVDSVEKENVGYDLIATAGPSKLLIEVKGTSLTDSDAITVNLTPNEYHRSKARRIQYRICIVTDCLNKPVVNEFAWKKEGEQWEDENSGAVLGIAEAVSANLTITRLSNKMVQPIGQIELGSNLDYGIHLN